LVLLTQLISTKQVQIRHKYDRQPVHLSLIAKLSHQRNISSQQLKLQHAPVTDSEFTASVATTHRQ